MYLFKLFQHVFQEQTILRPTEENTKLCYPAKKVSILSSSVIQEDTQLFFHKFQEFTICLPGNIFVSCVQKCIELTIINHNIYITLEYNDRVKLFSGNYIFFLLSWRRTWCNIISGVQRGQRPPQASSYWQFGITYENV